MKKVLLAFDGIHFSESAFDFARRMNEQSPILLVGVFVPQVDYANLWSYAESTSGTFYVPLLEEEDVEVVEKNMALFESLCEKDHIEFRVHQNFTDFAVPALAKESRFADLLIIGSQSFYSTLDKPSESLKDALRDAECPVLIVPDEFAFPESNVLTYDGSKDSVYAIKQFAYLFPQLCANETMLVHADWDNDDELPDQTYIEELAARHFSQLTIMKVQLASKSDFGLWMSNRKSSIVVTGAFSRSALSMIFKKSFITDVIRDHKLPVFIAHL